MTPEIPQIPHDGETLRRYTRLLRDKKTFVCRVDADGKVDMNSCLLFDGITEEPVRANLVINYR